MDPAAVTYVAHQGIIVWVGRQCCRQQRPIHYAQDLGLAVPLSVGGHISEHRGVHASSDEDPYEGTTLATFPTRTLELAGPR